MELFDYGWADDHDSNCNGDCNCYCMAVVSGIPAVERLIFDDRPVEHNLSWAIPEKSLCESMGSFFFGAKKYSLPYGGKRAYIERRNYYDESY